MSSFSKEAFLEKIARLSLSQDSIETLSLWAIQHKAHAADATQVWLEALKKASADKRLVLFYLANDILQNGRRRGADQFLELFQDPLRQGVTLIGGQKIQTSVERMFRIWKDRRVYSNAFLKELELLIEPVRKTQVNEPLPDFKLPLLQDALSEFSKFEAELKVKSSHLSNLRVDITNPTTSLSMLKDKSAGGRVSQEFEEASQRLQDYCECLGIEVNERINILDMLKECSIFTTYRLAELQRTAADYKSLNVSVKSMKKKIDQRVKDLERARSTATSDPSAKDDITDIGDMEIESDGENQDSQENAPKQSAPKPVQQDPRPPKTTIFNGPGMITTPPMATPMATPTPQQQHADYVQTTLPNNTYQAQQRPPQQQQQQQHNFRQQMSKGLTEAGLFRGMQTRFPARPTAVNTARGLFNSQRPLPQHRHPPPPRPQGQSPQVNHYHQMPPPVRVRTVYRGPPAARPQIPGGPPRAMVHAAHQSHTISGSPVVYKTTQPASAQPPPSAVATSAPAAGKVTGNTEGGGAASADIKQSLDERLKDMMLNKKFGTTVLKEQIDKDSDHKAFSPSSGDQDAMMVDEDQPSPLADSPVDDRSPKLNMNNPILKALYKSQRSPDAVPTSLVPDYDQEENDDELSSSDLKQILDQVKSSEPAEADSNSSPALPAGGYSNRPLPAPDGHVTSHLGGPPSSGAHGNPLPDGVVARTMKSNPPVSTEIKITPTLTNLLDEIFPQISKTLINRKRKQSHEEEEANDVAAKLPRLAATSNPQPTQQQPAHFVPHSPGALVGGRLPVPRSPGAVVGGRPHPFGRPPRLLPPRMLYGNVPPPPPPPPPPPGEPFGRGFRAGPRPRVRMEGRFMRPPYQRYPVPGFQPRMRTNQDMQPGAAAGGYRPQHSRYV